MAIAIFASAAGSPPCARGGHGLAAIDSGRLYVFGGISGSVTMPMRKLNLLSQNLLSHNQDSLLNLMCLTLPAPCIKYKMEVSLRFRDYAQAAATWPTFMSTTLLRGDGRTCPALPQVRTIFNYLAAVSMRFQITGRSGLASLLPKLLHNPGRHTTITTARSWIYRGGRQALRPRGPGRKFAG